MEMRELGRSGLMVSAACLGTMTYGEQNSQDDAFAQLDLAEGAGINFLDTAELYSIPPKAETQGRTEAIIGNWFAARGNRSRWVVATKAVGRAEGMRWFRDDGSAARLNKRNLEEAIGKSLKRLKIDHVDLYQLHWPDRPLKLFEGQGYQHIPNDDIIPPEETLRALQDLVTSGKVKAIGLSNETPWGLLSFLKASEMADLPRVATVQNAYHLLNRTDEYGLTEIYIREGVSSLPYSPLGQGTLTGKYLDGARPEGSRKALFNRMQRYETPGSNERVREYRDLAAAHGLTLVQMALAFVNSRPFVGATIIGGTTLPQLEENIAAFEIRLDGDILSAIDAIHQRQPNPCP